MYNVLHTASSPGASDAFRARPGRRERLLLRRRRGPSLPQPVAPVEGGGLVALCEARAVEDRLDDVLR